LANWKKLTAVDPASIIETEGFGPLADRHAENSRGSPFVSVTTDLEVASYFATHGRNPSGFVAVVQTNRAVPNPANPGQSEYSIPVQITAAEIKGIYPASLPKE
jgi:hypothetical protein